MAATKNNMLGEEMSPFLTTIEPEVVEWCACQFGLGSGAGSTLRLLAAAWPFWKDSQ
jgi:hypothetical protein